MDAGGITDAVQHMLAETNPLFDDMRKKLEDYPELKAMLYAILFRGQPYPYNPDNPAIGVAAMFGLMREHAGRVGIANQIFKTRLYNLFLSDDLMKGNAFLAGDVRQFARDGYLDMGMVVQKFAEHYTEVYAGSDEKFLGENGRRLFLLYLRPIINGAGRSITAGGGSSSRIILTTTGWKKSIWSVFALTKRRMSARAWLYVGKRLSGRRWCRPWTGYW